MGLPCSITCSCAVYLLFSSQQLSSKKLLHTKDRWNMFHQCAIVKDQKKFHRYCTCLIDKVKASIKQNGYPRTYISAPLPHPSKWLSAHLLFLIFLYFSSWPSLFGNWKTKHTKFYYQLCKIIQRHIFLNLRKKKNSRQNAFHLD